MVVERSQVQFGRTPIPYSIRRSSRRNTVAVAVEPTGDVLLTAPFGTPIAKLDRVVHSKASWIVGHWRRIRDLPSTAVRHEFVNGETFLYLGRQYRLRIVRGLDQDVRLHRGELQVEADANGRQRPIRKSLVRWYVERAAHRLPERVKLLAPKLGVRVSRVLVREQQKRWGSCAASGVIRLNWRIVQAPLSLVDYVVVHELAHLRHRNHSDAYWRLVGRVLPDYEDRRERLRKWGNEAIW